MMRKLQKIACLALMTGLFSASAFGQIATPPVIDGDGGDAIWATAPAMELLREHDVTTKVDDADFSATVKALWDADNFYVLLEMMDDTLDTESLNPWERDHYSVYLDFGNHKTTTYLKDTDMTKDSVQFMLEKIWSIEGDLSFSNQLGALDSMLVWGVHFVENIDSGSMYTLEVVIPMDILGMDPLQASDVIGFDAKVGDNDGGTLDRLSLYQPQDQGYQDPSYLGTAQLEADGSISRVKHAPVIDGKEDYALYAAAPAQPMLVEHDVTTKDDDDDFSGTFRVMHDLENVYVLLEMMDDTLDTESLNPWERDHYSVYFDFGNLKTATYQKDADMTKDSVQFMLEKIWSIEGDLSFSNQLGALDSMLVWGVHFVENIDSGSSYTLEVVIPMDILGMDPLQEGAVIGIDAKLGDNDGGTLDRLSWHQSQDQGYQNPSFLGNMNIEPVFFDLGPLTPAPRQIVIDGEKEASWNQAIAMPLLREHDVTTKVDDADFSGTVRGMWDAENFYVLLEMWDDTLDTESLNPWERDHYSLYFDFGNLKTTTYVLDMDETKDSVQFMLEKIWSVEGDLAFSNQVSNLDSSLVWGVHFAEVIDSGTMYTLEVGIPLEILGVKLMAGDTIGWDAKIGDNDGGTLDRLSWNQFDDQGYQNPSFLGTVTLMGNGTIMGTPETPTEDVTINVDMSGMIDLGAFDASVDFVDLAGSMNNWGDPVVQAADDNADGIYTSVVAAQDVGTVLEFKFRINGSWDELSHELFGADNRMYTVVEGENIVNVVFNDGDYAPWMVEGVEVDRASLIHMYPNPASSTLNIQNVADIRTIELVNLLGQVTYKQLNSGNSSVVMSIEDQASGVYMIRFTGEANEISYKKLIIE